LNICVLAFAFFIPRFPLHSVAFALVAAAVVVSVSMFTALFHARPRNDLYKICPPSIEQMLGSSVSRVKEDISKASSEASLAAGGLADARD
jgi:hypothetical protein